MDFLGFLKEHDKNIRNASLFSDMLGVQEDISVLREAVIDYLKNGIVIGGTMSHIVTLDGVDLGPNLYMTDGYFIWPIYYPYYLSRYNTFLLDSNFINKFKEGKLVKKDLSASFIDKIDIFFTYEWAGQYKKSEEFFRTNLADTRLSK